MHDITRRSCDDLAFIAAALGVFAALAPAASADVTGTVVIGRRRAALQRLRARGRRGRASRRTRLHRRHGQLQPLHLDVLAAGVPADAHATTYDDPCLPSEPGADRVAGRRRPTASCCRPSRCPRASSAPRARRTASAAPLLPPTAYVDSAGGRVLSGAGGIAYLRLRDPVRRDRRRGALQRRPDRRRRCRPARAYYVQITAPAVGGSGALTATYAINGVPLLAHARHARRDRRDQGPARHVRPASTSRS